MILLDTNFCVDWLREVARGSGGPAGEKLRSLEDMPLGISLFTCCELEGGAACSRDPVSEATKISRLFDHVAIVHPGRGFPSLYGQILARLRLAGSMIPVMDLFIGLCALQEGAAVLTRDSAHFSRIPGLRIETY
jgi:predicted nucleic acid-binding protein